MSAPLRRNRARCLLCRDVIESLHRHDFRWCKCGAIFVDGGKDYRRRGWDDSKVPPGVQLIEDMSEGWGDADG